MPKLKGKWDPHINCLGGVTNEDLISPKWMAMWMRESARWEKTDLNPSHPFLNGISAIQYTSHVWERGDRELAQFPKQLIFISAFLFFSCVGSREEGECRLKELVYKLTEISDWGCRCESCFLLLWSRTTCTGIREARKLRGGPQRGKSLSTSVSVVRKGTGRSQIIPACTITPTDSTVRFESFQGVFFETFWVQFSMGGEDRCQIWFEVDCLVVLLKCQVFEQWS